MIINKPPEIIPKRTRDEYTNFKEIGKSSSKSNYILFRATSKIDEKPYTIRVLNIVGDLYKRKKNLAIKLYLQELFYLSARFGINQGDIDSSDEILCFQNFEVGDDGSMAFVMRDSVPLADLVNEKADSASVRVEEFIRQVYANVLFINSRFGVANIDLNFESIYCFSTGKNGALQTESDRSVEYYITNWDSGNSFPTPLELMLQDSTISILEEDSMKIDDFLCSIESVESKTIQMEHSETSRVHFAPEELKTASLQSNAASDVYCIGLLALELAGMPMNRWKDLVQIEDPKNYALILDSIVQSLAHDYKQSNSLCQFVSEMLNRDPEERITKIRKKLFSKSRPIRLNEFSNESSQTQHSSFIQTELFPFSKVLKSEKRIEVISSVNSLARTSDEDSLEKKLELKLSERKKSKIRIIEDTTLKDSEFPRKNNPNKDQIQQLEKEYQIKILLEKDKHIKLVAEWQVHLLIVLEKIYGDKIPLFQLIDPEVCIRNTLKLILKKLLRESQPRSKKPNSNIKALIHSVDPDDIKQIFLSSQSITDCDAIALGKNTKWLNLTELFLHNNQISDSGVTELAENQHWVNLEILDLRGNLITDEGAVKIGKNQSWLSLQQLWLYQNMIRDEGAISIASNTAWKKLECLDLSRNFISDDGITAIGANTTWKKLRILQLYENEIGDRGAIALAGNKTWKNLNELDLEKNRIGFEGAKALATNTSWTHLAKCYLSGNCFDEIGTAFILESNKWEEMADLIFDYEHITLGLSCDLCYRSLKEIIPQCYNYQKKVYYCLDCVKREESTLLGITFGMRKYIDTQALIFIDVTDTSGLKTILAKRIGDQIHPRNIEAAKEFSYHEVGCNLCMTTIGKKIRWKCLNCKNIDLCNNCYLLSSKRDMNAMVALKIKGHEVESHILQRYIFIEKN